MRKTGALMVLLGSLLGCGSESPPQIPTGSTPATGKVTRFSGQLDYTLQLPNAGGSQTATAPVTIEVIEDSGQLTVLVVSPPWFLPWSWEAVDAPPDQLTLSHSVVRNRNSCQEFTWPPGQGAGVFNLTHAHFDLSGALFLRDCDYGNQTFEYQFTASFSGDVVR